MRALLLTLALLLPSIALADGFAPAQGAASGGGNPTGYSESGGTVTITDELNVGTTTLAVATGDLAAGQTGGFQIGYDQSLGRLNLHGSSGTLYGYIGDTSSNLLLNGTIGIQFQVGGVSKVWVLTGGIYPTTGNTLSLGTTSLTWTSGYYSTSLQLGLGQEAVLSAGTAGILKLSTPSADAEFELYDSAGALSGSVAGYSSTLVLETVSGNDIRMAIGGPSTVWQFTTAAILPIGASQDIGGTANEVDQVYALGLQLGTSQDVTLTSNGSGGLTLTDEVNVGTATDAVAIGDFASGQSAGNRLLFDESVSRLGIITAAGGTFKSILSTTTGLELTSNLTVSWAPSTNAAAAKDLALVRDGAAGLLKVYDPSASADSEVRAYNTASTLYAYIRGEAAGSTIGTSAGSVIWQSSTTHQWNVGGSAVFGATSTAVFPSFAGLRDLGTTALEWGDVFTSGTISIGAGQEVNLALSGTALAVDTGILAEVDIEINTAVAASPNIITAAESGRAFINTGATARNYHTLPSAVIGLRYRFCVDDVDGMRITANTGDTIAFNGAGSSSAGYIEGSTAGGYVELVAVSASKWSSFNHGGDWEVYNGTTAVPATSLTAGWFVTNANKAASGAITGGTPIVIGGTGTAATNRGFTITTTTGGFATYDGIAQRDFIITATISMTSTASNNLVRFYIAENDAEIDGSEAVRKIGTGSDTGSLVTQAHITASTNDTYKIFVDLDGSTTDTVTVENLHVAITPVSVN